MLEDLRKLNNSKQIHHAVAELEDSLTNFTWSTLEYFVPYIHPSKEANTNKVWKLQKCVYGLADIKSY